MTPDPPPDSSRSRLLDPLVLGPACGLTSALVYTCANSFLRAVDDCDPFWVSAIKALPTALAAAPIVAWMAFRGRRVWPAPRLIAAIAVGGLLGQLGGNVSFQWALGEIGVALTVSLSLGGMIVAAATFGRIFLAEPLTPRVLVALSFLLAAIAVLSLGAPEAGRSVVLTAVPSWRLAAGVAAGCAAGMFYATLNVILRYCFLRGANLPMALLIVSMMGLLTLGLLSWLRIGTTGMLATRADDLALMLAAGACNTVAFAALTKSLQLTSVVLVNALNATQATLAAIAGVVIFREALSPWLALGVGLTIVGLLVMTWAHRAIIQPPTE